MPAAPGSALGEWLAPMQNQCLVARDLGEFRGLLLAKFVMWCYVGKFRGLSLATVVLVRFLKATAPDAVHRSITYLFSFHPKGLHQLGCRHSGCIMQFNQFLHLLSRINELERDPHGW